MAKRSGFGISAKMILNSTLLVVLTVAGFGIMSVLTIQGAYETSARQAVERSREAMGRKGEATIQVVARAMQKSADSDLQTLVERIAAQDPDLEMLYVLSGDRRVLAYCRVVQGSAGSCAPDPSGIDSAGPGIQQASWKQAEEIWQQRMAGGTDDALVAFELDFEHGPAQFFAYRSSGKARAPAAAPTPAPGRGAYVVLAYTLAAKERIAAESQEQIKSAKWSVMLRTVALGGVFALIGTVLAIFQGLSISRSIGELAWKADRIARGDFQARVEVLAGDEIGMLGHKFNAMADRLVSLRAKARDKATAEQELDVARIVQETLVPPNEPVDCGLVNIAGFFQPASPCGGDWWTYRMLQDQKLLLVIGHGSGRGVPAALLTATAKAACDAACMAHDDDLALTKLVQMMNSAIYQSARRRLVMTCFASVIDLKSRVITYANAGHDFPYLYRLGEDGSGEFGSLMIRGNRLGDLKESHYESTSTQLRPGDTLIWYTQGLVQGENEHGEAYGEKRFRASIRRAAHLGAGDMRNTVVSEAMSFYGDTPRKDDITLIVGRVT